jgi:hypothetical protein
LDVPNDGRFEGSLREFGPDSSGLDIVVLDGQVHGSQVDRVHVVLQGTPLAGGGIEMQRSRVYVGPVDAPALYAGTVRALDGTRVVADLRNAGGQRVELALLLDLADQSHITGAVRVTGTGDD